MPRPIALVLPGLELEAQLADLGWDICSVGALDELASAPAHRCAFVPVAVLEAGDTVERTSVLCAVGTEAELQACSSRADLYLATPISRSALVGVLRSAEALSKTRAEFLSAPATIDADSDNIAALRNSHALLRTLVEAAADAIVVVETKSALIVEANPAARALFGYTLSELRQMTGRNLSPQSEASKIDALSASIVEHGAAQHPKLEMWRKDGSRFWAWMRSQTFQVAGHSCAAAGRAGAGASRAQAVRAYGGARRACRHGGARDQQPASVSLAQRGGARQAR